MTPDDLVREHADLVYRIARRITGNDADAADASQDALIKVWRHLESIEEPSRRGWTARVARNASLDLLRRRKSRPQPLHADSTPQPDHEQLLPDANAEWGEARSRLSDAVESLDEPYRSIIVLREIEGLTYAEVAETLDLPLNTLKVYLHRARRRLQAELQDVFAEMLPSP